MTRSCRRAAEREIPRGRHDRRVAYPAAVDVATFLGRHPPFDALDEAALARVAANVEIEHFAPGDVILEQAGEPSHHLYVIRKGEIEILDDGRVIDLMSTGEAFGMWSLLGRFSPTAGVRAHEETLCYLVPADVAADVLESPPGIAFVMRSLRRRLSALEESRATDRATDPFRPVGSLVRRDVVTIAPDASVADAAATMTRERVSCLLVPTDDGWGILTDRDLRSRVVAETRDPASTRVEQVMTRPALTVRPVAMAGEVLLEMLDRGFHHFPVEREDGDLAGVVTDTDLMGLGRHTPFSLASAIERAESVDEVAGAARDLPNVTRALVAASTDPVEIGHVVAASVDAMTRRLLELGIRRFGEPPVEWAWLALGSEARQEQALRTDQDHALAYDAREADEDGLDGYFGPLAAFVTDGLEAAGIPRCRGDAMAANRALRHSVDGWVAQFSTWMREPGMMGSVLLSIVFDYRRVAGALDVERRLDDVVRSAPAHPLFLRHLSRRALDDRPPTGFFRDLVVEARGEHAGRLDVKHGGITIVGNLARAAAISRGLTQRRTIERLRAAASAGALDEDLADGLEEAFRFLWQVRLRHQVRRLDDGEEPDDFVDPKELGPVARHGLKEAFKVIERAQRLLAADLGVTVR
jgi:CBS domain-containing protein